MKLQKQVSRVIDGKEYYKWVVIIPPSHIEQLGWDEGMELTSEVRGNAIIIKPFNNLPKKPKKMTYEEFKQIIKEELEKSPEGLTWTRIKERRPELYQRVPNNLWVRMLETDIGLIREKVEGKTIWRLRK